MSKELRELKERVDLFKKNEGSKKSRVFPEKLKLDIIASFSNHPIPYLSKLLSIPRDTLYGWKSRYKHKLENKEISTINNEIEFIEIPYPKFSSAESIEIKLSTYKGNSMSIILPYCYRDNLKDVINSFLA